MPSWVAERINGSNERRSVNSVPKPLDVLLKDKPVSTLARNVLLRMNPTRQVEARRVPSFRPEISLQGFFAGAFTGHQAGRSALQRGKPNPYLACRRERIANMQQDLECLLKTLRLRRTTARTF